MRRWAAELAVIALGVFVGLAAEGWTEERREGREAREIVALVGADLLADSLAVEEAIEGVETASERIRDMLSMLSGDLPDLESALRAGSVSGDVMNPKLRFRTGGYTALVSSGRIAALEPVLAARLTNLYESDYGAVYETLDIVEFIVNGYFTANGEVWNSLAGGPRPGGDVVDFTNMAIKYQSIAGIFLTRLRNLRGAISEARTLVGSASSR